MLTATPLDDWPLDDPPLDDPPPDDSSSMVLLVLQKSVQQALHDSRVVPLIWETIYREKSQLPQCPIDISTPWLLNVALLVL